jgi:hypothetical protein
VHVIGQQVTFFDSTFLFVSTSVADHSSTTCSSTVANLYWAGILVT